MNLPGQLHAFAAESLIETRTLRRQIALIPATQCDCIRGLMAFAGSSRGGFSGLGSAGCARTNRHPLPGPPALDKAIADHPTSAAYDALGAHFASKSQFACAISAFRNAIRLEPDTWQGHYNLGVALLTTGEAQKAADELKTALKFNQGSAANTSSARRGAQYIEPSGRSHRHFSRHSQPGSSFGARA